MRAWTTTIVCLLMVVVSTATATDPTIFVADDDDDDATICDFRYVPCGECCMLLVDDDHAGFRFEDVNAPSLRQQIERDLACTLRVGKTAIFDALCAQQPIIEEEPWFYVPLSV